MATIKSYTDIEQSKKLAEILPLESADHFHIIGRIHTDGPKYEVIRARNEVVETDKYWPCWSLAALINVLPSVTLDSSDDHHFRLRCMEKFTEWHDNAIDTCVEMIEKLHKQMIYDFNNS